MSQGRRLQRTDPEPITDDVDTFTPYNPEDGYRARVRPYSTAANFPVAPLYEVGEEVYVAEGAGVEGPFEVLSSDSSNKYKLKHKTTGQQRDGVAEAKLREKK